MKPAQDGKKRKLDNNHVSEKKKSKKKKKAKKQKSIECDVVGIDKDDNVAKKSSSTSIMSSIFGSSISANSSDNGSKEGNKGTTASSSLIHSIFDMDTKKSTTPKTSSTTMSLFSNPSIPAVTRRNHHQQQQVAARPKPATATSREESAETIRQTLRNRKQRSQNRPLLKRALDFPGVFENEEKDEGNGGFMLDDENERAKETADAIRDHGFCILRNVMDLNDGKKKQKNKSAEDFHPLRDIVLPEAKKLQRRLNEALKARGIHHSTETFRFRQAASRCRGRTDVVFDAFDRDPEMARAKQKILRNPKILPVILNLLGGASGGGVDDDENDDDGGVKLVYAGLILSYPDSCDQPWHQDGEPLFPELPGDQSAVLQASLPPYALNVFLPLEDGDGSIEKGPTEFLPGSHKWTDPHERLESIVEAADVEDERKEEPDDSDSPGASDEESNHDYNAIIAPVLKQGDALIYDYRVCHRGTANLFGRLGRKEEKKGAKDDQSDVVGSRRIIYLMYARPWFTDHVNFDYRKSAESLWDDQKSAHTKK